MDDARTIAFDPAAPAGERYDANAALGAAYKPLASALLPAEDLRPVIEWITADLEDQALRKASNPGLILPGDNRGNRQGGMRSVYLDDFGIFSSGEYFEKPSPMGFATLREMVEQTPVLSSVVMTRQRQISRFCQISEDGGPGFEIRHVDRKHKLQPDEAETCRLLARFVANCGWEWSPRRRKAMHRDNFTQFMLKSVRDSLSMDACPIETEMKRNRALGIDGFYAVDGSTIRLCSEQGYDGDDKIFAVQVVEGRLSTTYTYDQLIYEVRNPRTDVRLTGYGLGETELLVRVVTGFLNAMNYNSSGFDKNAIPKGILNVVGDYGAEEKAAFRRYWNAMVKGVNNAWTLPVLFAEDAASKVTFERFGIDFNEMMFSKWMTFLASIICAIYGMSPDEINFESFAAARSSLSGSDTEAKLADSKDKGLLPLMAFYETTISDFIIGEFGGKYCFRWVGLTGEDEALEWDKKQKVLSLDEARAEQGYEPYPDPAIGSAPLNPSLIGPWQAAQQAAQQAQQQPDFGQAPDDGQGGQGGQGGQDQGADGTAGAPGDQNQDATVEANGNQAEGATGAAAGQPRASFGGKDTGDFGGAAGAAENGDFGKALALPSIWKMGE